MPIIDSKVEANNGLLALPFTIIRQFYILSFFDNYDVSKSIIVSYRRTILNGLHKKFESATLQKIYALKPKKWSSA